MIGPGSDKNPGIAKKGALSIFFADLTVCQTIKKVKILAFSYRGLSQSWQCKYFHLNFYANHSLRNGEILNNNKKICRDLHSLHLHPDGAESCGSVTASIFERSCQAIRSRSNYWKGFLRNWASMPAQVFQFISEPDEDKLGSLVLLSLHCLSRDCQG